MVWCGVCGGVCCACECGMGGCSVYIHLWELCCIMLCCYVGVVVCVCVVCVFIECVCVCVCGVCCGV